MLNHKDLSAIELELTTNNNHVMVSCADGSTLVIKPGRSKIVFYKNLAFHLKDCRCQSCQ